MFLIRANLVYLTPLFGICVLALRNNSIMHPIDFPEPIGPTMARNICSSSSINFSTVGGGWYLRSTDNLDFHGWCSTASPSICGAVALALIAIPSPLLKTIDRLKAVPPPPSPARSGAGGGPSVPAARSSL